MPVTSQAAIQQGDCIQLMREMPAECIDLAFADPPFNIGYQYDKYHDEQTDDDYLDWSRSWMEEVHRLLTPTGSFWLAIGDEYAADLKVIADRQIGFTTRSWVVWYYTFGVNCKRKFSRSHVHLFHFVKDPDQFTFNADDPNIRIPSARALVYGDKRANPKGRLPDDTWILRPQDFQSDQYGFDTVDDTWYFSRVAGTFKERQGFHGCQMPEQLLGRIIRVSSQPGDVVFDPFTGSGTTLAVAKKLGRKWRGCELSEDYVRYAGGRLAPIREGDRLNGPTDAIGSAPTTANGRRLKRTKEQPLLPMFDPSDFTPQRLQDQPLAPETDIRQLQQQLLGEAFLQAGEGRSVDDLITNPQLQDAFHKACGERGLLGTPNVWNQELLRLRKSGELPPPTRETTPALPATPLDQVQFAAEIAWQLTNEKLGTASSGIMSIEEILSHGESSAFFDRTASRYAPGFTSVDYRCAALDFHEQRPAWTADAKTYDYVFATRDFEKSRKLTPRATAALAGVPGVYLLTGARRTPLFIGQALDLGARLQQHLTAPATKRKVTGFAVIFQSALPSGEYRAPLMVDFVRRHKPRWNLTDKA